jgi:Short C-terminal domain
MMPAMILVPRQLRRSDFPSSVPYYGGRLTPQVIAGLGRRPTPSPAPVAGGESASEQDRSRQLAALDELRAQGVVTEGEYEEIRRRLLQGS